MRKSRNNFLRNQKSEIIISEKQSDEIYKYLEEWNKAPDEPPPSVKSCADTPLLLE